MPVTSASATFRSPALLPDERRYGATGPGRPVNGRRPAGSPNRLAQPARGDGAVRVAPMADPVGAVDPARPGPAARTFRHVRLRDAEFRGTGLTGVRFRGVELDGVVLRGAYLKDVEVHGEIEGLTVNGVDVAAYVRAELDRRDPERVLLRPTDADGFRRAWDLVERRWAGTVDRAAGLDPELLHRSVEGEWSFVETLRHLVFATDSWVRRAMLGDPAPWDPLDLPWDEMRDTPGIPRDRTARPSLDTVLALRRDRMATVLEVFGRLTDADLDGHTEPVDAPGWPRPDRYPVRLCLETVLTEEWEHRLFAERDLDVLAGPAS